MAKQGQVRKKINRKALGKFKTKLSAVDKIVFEKTLDILDSDKMYQWSVAFKTLESLSNKIGIISEDEEEILELIWDEAAVHEYNEAIQEQNNEQKN